MTSFNCYALNDVIEGHSVAALDDYVDFEDRQVTTYGPVAGVGFQAKLYVSNLDPREPSWAAFLTGGFTGLAVPEVEAVGALVIVRLDAAQYFAFTFGGVGRHLMREGAWRRNYGLRTALNLIYPNQPAAVSDENRLLGMDSRRRASRRTRSRTQATRVATLEDFDFDQLRDILRGATGRPVDTETWGPRVTGTDAFYFDIQRDFDALGELCESIQAAHELGDYKQRFAWLDRVQVVSDPDELRQLEQSVAHELSEANLQTWDLAPPEIADWMHVRSFRLPFEGARGVTHPELRIQDVVAKLRASSGGIDVPKLRRSHITALSDDGSVVDRWSIWRCLSGEFEFGGETYVLDSDEFLRIDRDYLNELNALVGTIPAGVTSLPSSTQGEVEKAFNARAAGALGKDAVLLDAKNVRTTASTTAIEVCDIFTANRCLLHVKRHFDADGLSHLFAQGQVSAELLQNSHEFRVAAQEQIDKLTNDPRYRVFGTPPIMTSDFEIGYVIVGQWRGRSVAQALPFFSKVNLCGALQNLTSRGYRVSCSAVKVSM